MKCYTVINAKFTWRFLGRNNVHGWGIMPGRIHHPPTGKFTSRSRSGWTINASQKMPRFRTARHVRHDWNSHHLYRSHSHLCLQLSDAQRWVVHICLQESLVVTILVILASLAVLSEVLSISLKCLEQRFSTFSDSRTTWQILSQFADHQNVYIFLGKFLNLWRPLFRHFP